ncbi:MAG: regulatory protein RecX [Bacteroidales bacterium]|nr:regulatory protein RecX [Bacteroidales bacterium]
MTTPRQPLSPEAAFTRAAARCATTEYCNADWRRRLAQAGLTPQEVADVLERLQREGFIDEARYARAYAHDKALYDRWGQLKIRQGLAAKGIADEDIAAALADVDEDVWEKNLRDLLTQKNRSLRAADDYERRQKLMRFAAGRGYETELIFGIIDQFSGAD